MHLLQLSSRVIRPELHSSITMWKVGSYEYAADVEAALSNSNEG
jgi:hypothetical protein